MYFVYNHDKLEETFQLLTPKNCFDHFQRTFRKMILNT